MNIELIKNIPLGSGLGGASSNAATTLMALSKIWKLGIAKKELMHLASSLGSDVPLFLNARNAWIEGRGEKIKNIKVEVISLANSVKVTLNGDGEMIQIEISNETMKEEKSILEDLIIAAHNNAKAQLKSKTTEEISKATGGLGIPGFKWPI